MLKSEARNYYRAKRNEITPQQKMKLDDLLLIQFQKLFLPPIYNLLSFVPIEGNNEINTFLLTDYLAFTNPGLQVAYPKTNLLSAQMQAIVVTDDTVFEENNYRIPEPAAGEVLDPAMIDVVLLPMLGFDKKGNRVGYGKGFYDRFLKQCTDDCIKIGLCYFEAVDALDDTNEFDVPLNYCITPQMIYVF